MRQERLSRERSTQVLWRCEVLFAFALAAWLGLTVVPRLRGAMEWARYRSAMQTLTGTVRAMRSQALTQHRIVQLRVDATRGLFQFAAIYNSPQPYETVERTIWLPKELQITDAPAVLTALPTGLLSSASIVISAPSYNRLFRVTTDKDGHVRLDEEPTL